MFFLSLREKLGTSKQKSRTHPTTSGKAISDFNWIRESANKTIILSSTNMYKQLNANNTIFVESQLAD